MIKRCTQSGKTQIAQAAPHRASISNLLGRGDSLSTGLAYTRTQRGGCFYLAFKTWRRLFAFSATVLALPSIAVVRTWNCKESLASYALLSDTSSRDLAAHRTIGAARLSDEGTIYRKDLLALSASSCHLARIFRVLIGVDLRHFKYSLEGRF
jgi:hypothetical protein